MQLNNLTLQVRKEDAGIAPQITATLFLTHRFFSQLQNFTVELFKSTAHVFRIARCKDEADVMAMIDFFNLQVKGNDFVEEDGLKGPIGPMEMVVMVCRDNLATPAIRARLVESVQSSIGVWASVCEKELGDWNYQEGLKTEGIWAR